MVYIKAVLNDKRPKQDNLYPLLIRITFNRSNTTVSTGLRVKQEDWDKVSGQIKRSNPNFQLLNRKLSEVYFKVQKVALKLEDTNEFSFENLKDGLSEKVQTVKKTLTFNEYADQIISELLEVKRTGNAVVYRTAVNRLVKHCNNPKLQFTEITYTLLEGFSRKLTVEGAKPNTIGNYFRSIRAIFNKAIKAKLVDRSYYPFTEIQIKTSKTAKRATSQVELSALTELILKPGSKEWHARNYFYLSFSLVGISFTDMAYLKTENIINGRLVYIRRKTHKHYSINLTNVARKLISYYTHTGKYLLPVLSMNVEEDSLESKKQIQQFIKTTNKYLSRIGKLCKIENLTTYVARHTWATTAKRLGYSNELIAESMGHEYGNKITNIYLDNFDQSIIDEVNERVVSILDK